MDRRSADQAPHRHRADAMACRFAGHLARRDADLPPRQGCRVGAARFTDGRREGDKRRGRHLDPDHVAAARGAGQSGERGGRRERGRRCGRPAVRAGIHLAESRVVGASRRRSHAGGTGCARPRATTSRRRLSRRARSICDARAGRSHRPAPGPALLDLPTVTVSTFRQLPLSRLGHLVPPLIDGAALVALMPVTDDLQWAAKAAWDIGRIAARDGRRVALVDLCLEHPALHEITGLESTEGIVDAFEYGVSLNKAAHEVTGVFIIPAGSDTAHPAEGYGHGRWPKLQAGFRSGGALLIVMLPLAGLAQLSATPAGVFVLAPEGLAPNFALPREVPLLGVVRDRWLPSNPRPSPPAMPTPVTEHPRRGLRVAVAALAVAALAVGGWALLARAREAFVAPPAAPAPRVTSPATSTTSTNHHQPPPAPAPARRDTLGWTVRLAAYASLDKALAHADRLAADGGVPALVTPVPQSGKGQVWYRVLAGSYGTRAAAGTARASLWRRGMAAEGVGDLVLAPYSYHAPAGTSLEQLRHRGLPAMRWSNGVILLGAFEGPDQAAYTQAALKRAGVRANLLPRMGTP